MNEVEKILTGDVRSAARLIRRIDDMDPGIEEILKGLYPHTGKARVIGITGSPGAGKSTICNRMITAYRKQGLKVGALAVDPSSPYSGGALLGDRIRMQEHSTDPGVFIRSMATRGNLGGLSSSTCDAIKVMDAMGMDVVLVETVGVGQDEVDIARAAHTTLVVLIPGMGDDIQAIKAGLLEVADCFVVNKADREGADKVVRELSVMLEMRGFNAEEWVPPIVKMIALQGEGIDPLLDAVSSHEKYCRQANRVKKFQFDRLKNDLIEILKAEMMDAMFCGLEDSEGGLDGLILQQQEKGRDPYTIADEVIAAAARKILAI